MRNIVTALSIALLSVTTGVAASRSKPEGNARVLPESGAWPDAGAAQDLGFAPLSITQGGSAYTPPEAPFDPAASDAQSIADLPAWASSTRASSDGDDFLTALSHGRFGDLPEPAAWALIIIGFGMIGGALRGLLVANRRLMKLRDTPED